MNQPHVSQQPGTETLVAEVAHEFMARLRRGEHPDVEDYARCYPRIATVLRHVLPALPVIGSSAQGRSAAPLAFPAEIQPEGPLGDYRIVRELGRGGMGIVYQAVQISLGREVALKVLPFAAALDPKQLQRFKNEAQAAAHLHHTNIVPVYGVGCERGVHYYAMQYIEGQTVAAIVADLRRLSGRGPQQWENASGRVAALTRDLVSGRWTPARPGEGRSLVPATVIGPDPPPAWAGQGSPQGLASPSSTPVPTERSTQQPAYFRTVAGLGVQASRALEYAHSLGVIHRDIKPANLIVDGRGNLWITDFGLARVRGADELTVTGDLVGTLRYMSPEQALAHRSGVDHRTDVYSLGMTLYELLTLEPAFDGRDRSELLRRIAFEEPRRPQLLNKAVPSDLETIVLKAIEKVPAERYATAGELAEDLQRFLDDKTIRARRPTPWERARKWARRHWPVVATAAVAVVCLLAVLSVFATLAAVWRGQQLEATRQAQREGQHRLYDAKLAQAQASRWSGRAGRRFKGLDALTEAARLARDLDRGPEAILTLRHEAIACMILPDLRLDRQWEGSPPQSGPPVGVAFDPQLERYARVEADGTVTVRGLADNAIRVQITDLGAPAQRMVDWRVNLRFSPDGRLLATRSEPRDDVPLQVWDLSGPRRILSVPACGRHYFQDFDFSPDSRLLATGQADGSIGLYDLRSSRLLKSLAPGSSPARLRFHPAGQTLAVARDGDPGVQILDLAGWPSGPPLPHPDWVTATPAWHADGELLASGCRNGQVQVWYARTGRSVAVCKGHRREVVHVAFSQGGDLLASSSWDGTTRLWDPRTGRQLVSADGFVGDFSRDDRWLGGELGGPYVGRWEVATGHECRLLRGDGDPPGVNSLDVHRDGRLLAAAADDGVRLWDLSTGKQVQVLRLGRTCSVSFDPSGRFLVTSGHAGLCRWPTRWDPDPSAGCLRLGPAQALDLPPGCRPGWYSPSRDGQRAALLSESSEEVLFLDLARPRRRPRSVNERAVYSAAISPDGRWVATGTWNGYHCKVWDAQTGRGLQDFPARVARAAFSPDHRWFVIGTIQEYAVHQLEAGRWECRRRLPRDQGAASPGLVAFTWDAQMVALAGSSRSIQLLETQQWREFATVSAPDSEELTSLCFSPDGSRLAAGTTDGTIQLWDLRRIRARLRRMGLDWEPPAQSAPSNDDGKPLRVEVDRGSLPDPERDSLILALCPFDAQAYYRRGLAFEQRGRLREALDDFRRALVLKPDHAAAAYHRGQVRARQGERAKAIADWSRAIALEPDHANALAARGDAYYSLGRWDEAAGDYLKLVALRPDWPEPHNDGAWLLATHPDPRRRDPGRALALARRAVDLDPDEGDSWNTLGVAQYRAGDWRGAIKTLEQAIALHGRTSHDEFFLAMARWQLGERDEALRLYDRAIEWMQKNRPNDEELRRFRAEAAAMLGIGGSSRSAVPRPGREGPPTERSGRSHPRPKSVRSTTRQGWWLGAKVVI
jgi:serine/threonine protein kinase/WD40 repeat protein/Flp pilus assembly protein TadD